MRRACGLASVGAIGVVVVLAACERPGSGAIQTPATTPKTTTVPTHALGPAGDLASILVAIVPTPAGTSTIQIDDAGPAIEACRAAGWPEMLPLDVARRVAVQGIGSPAWVVTPEGAWSTTIEGIGCTAAGDIEGPIASLELAATAPAGPPDSRVDPELRDRLPGRPHLAVVGATLATSARLVDPTPVVVTEQPQLRAAIVRWLEPLAAARRASCIADGMSEGLPSEAATARALAEAADAAVVHALQSEGTRVHFVVASDPSVVFDCYGQQGFAAVLLDVEGEVSLELDSNNGIDLMWISDLDGDGNEEALVEMAWMEDGMQDLGLVHGAGDEWSRTVLWSADTP